MAPDRHQGVTRLDRPRFLTAVLVALDVVGGSLAVLGVWKSSGPWEGVTAFGVGLVLVGQLLERRLAGVPPPPPPAGPVPLPRRDDR